MDRDQQLTQWCPIHHVEDSCIDDLNLKAWEDLKARVKGDPDWIVNEEYRTIVHVDGVIGVTSRCYLFWRGKIGT